MSKSSRAFYDWEQQQLMKDPEYFVWLDLMDKPERTSDMNINEVFPSKYLKASDLQGKKITVTISHVEMDDIGDGTKPVLYFAGKDKGLVLNKTNAAVIAHQHSPETDGWKGKEIKLYSAPVSFKGQMVDGLRVETVVPEATEDPDDVIPF